MQMAVSRPIHLLTEDELDSGTDKKIVRRSYQVIKTSGQVFPNVGESQKFSLETETFLSGAM